MELAIKYRGKTIHADDVSFIKGLIAENPNDSRFALSVKLCKAWNWVQPNGTLKDMVCRGLMLQLHRDGHIRLPARKRSPVNPSGRRKKPEIILVDQEPLVTPLKAVRPLRFTQVRRTPSEKLFNSLIEQYHYLGYCQPVGEHLKYIVYAQDNPIACMAWSSAPRHIKSRDTFIGWDPVVRMKNLPLLAYNTRFLILPWVRVQNLASHILAQMAGILPGDWQKQYNHPVYYLETFVDKTLFSGTCYKAALRGVGPTGRRPTGLTWATPRGVVKTIKPINPIAQSRRSGGFPCQRIFGSGCAMANKPKRIDLTPQDLRALLERAKATLSKEDYEKIKAMAETIEALSNVVDQKASAIKRLLKLLFGQKSEKKKNVLGNSDDGQSDDEKNGQDNTPDESKPQEEKDPPKKRKGHGRNGASSYTGAKRVTVNHETLKHCDPCPLCLKGKVYRKTPETVIRIVGSPPLQGTVYEMEKLRCNLCGEIFTAKPPEDIGTKKHDETAAAIITLLKYGNGFPFYRLEQFQANLGVPVPATTQWGLVEGFASLAKPAYTEMLQQAAQGDLFYIDDTTGKILSLMKEGETEIGRKGIFTTGILSKMQDQVGVFYFTGRNHAGENIADLLQNRLQGLGPPGLMCDALSRNTPKDLEVILSNCLTHGRRNFVDIISAFPDECRHVIETLAQVYKNDKIAREKNMSPQERLAFHQAESKPLMDDLHAWFEKQFQEKRVEPNSGLGKAITYMMKHWKALTRFLEIPGAPLDNNICERALKKAIIHRKNSLFYKTRNGALVGDMFMSLIQTCNMARENAFDYLVALQKNASAVAANPQKWLPWNFRQAISSTNQ